MKTSALIGHTSELCSTIFEWEKPADIMLSEFYKRRKYLGSHDRKYISELCYSLIRNFGALESIRITLSSEHDYFNDQNSLLMIYFTIFTPKSKEEDNYFTEILPDYKQLQKKILEAYGKTAASPFAVYSFPVWMISKFRALFNDEELTLFLNSLNLPAGAYIRLRDSNQEAELIKAFAKKGFDLVRSGMVPEAFKLNKRLNFYDIEGFSKGLFEVQDLGSQLVTKFSVSGKEEIVLDACAGAGGKSLQLVSILPKGSAIYCYDADPKRLIRLKERITGKRYNNLNIILDREGLEKIRNRCDLVLIDAPCSGSGTIRRNPDLKWRLKEKDVKRYSGIQLSILKEYSYYVRPGGNLAYITCSFFREENEDVINEFLETYKNFSLTNNELFFQKHGIENNSGFLRLYQHLHDTDGFTAAILERNT